MIADFLVPFFGKYSVRRPCISCEKGRTYWPSPYLPFLLALLMTLVWSPRGADARKPEDLSWIRMSSQDIVVYSSVGEVESRKILDIMRLFRNDCLEFLPVDPFLPPVPTRIFLLSSESAYEDIFSNSGSSAGTAGLFFPAIDANYIAVDLTAGAKGLATVFHEYFHFIAEHTMPNLPLWTNEGLAEFFSTYEIDDGFGTAGHPIKKHVTRLKFEEPMPFVDLFGVTGQSDVYHGGSQKLLFYSQSWALVHSQLTGTPTERETFLEYLAALANGMSGQAAMIDHLDLDEDRLLPDLPNRKGHLEMPRARPTDGISGQSYWSTTTAPMNEVMSGLGMFLVRLPRTVPQAPQHFFEEAMRLDPGDYQSYLGMGVIEGNRNPEEARTQFDRALEIAPRQPLVLDAYGEFLMDQYEKALERDPNTSDEILLEARSMFRACLEVDPEDSRALAGYAMDALERAAARYPTRIDLMVARCVFTARRGNHDEAWSQYQRDFLARKPGRDAIQSARRALAHASLVDAFNTAQSGKIEEGRIILENGLERYGDKRTNEDAWRQFAEAEAYGRHNRLVDRYNEGIKAMNRRDYRRALEIMEEVAAVAADPDLRQAAIANCEQLGPLAR
jgi:tetratricopeptide (TPR) repeat protein